MNFAAVTNLDDHMFLFCLFNQTMYTHFSVFARSEKDREPMVLEASSFRVRFLLLFKRTLWRQDGQGGRETFYLCHGALRFFVLYSGGCLCIYTNLRSGGLATAAAVLMVRYGMFVSRDLDVFVS